MEDFNKYIKDTNEAIDIEAKRIMNKMRREGFEITDEENSILFIQMTIESIGNKISIGLMLQEKGELSDNLHKEMVSTSIHVCCRMIHAINGHKVVNAKMGMNDYTKRLMLHEALFSELILEVVSELQNF